MNYARRDILMAINAGAYAFSSIQAVTQRKKIGDELKSCLAEGLVIELETGYKITTEGQKELNQLNVHYQQLKLARLGL